MTIEDSRAWRDLAQELIVGQELIDGWKAERERRIKAEHDLIALQAEVDELWPYRKRAEKAEQERDEAKYGVKVAKHQRDNWESIARQALAEQPRPLTPDADAGISYLDQPTLTAITNLGEALDDLSRAWPGHFDIDIAVKSSGEQIAAWHQEDGVSEWYFGHKEQS